MKAEIEIPIELKDGKAIVDNEKLRAQISNVIFDYILDKGLTVKKPIKFEYDRVYMINEFETEPYEAESLSINE